VEHSVVEMTLVAGTVSKLAFVGTHMTAGIELRALLTLGLVVAGILTAVSAGGVHRRSWRWSLAVLGLVALVAGGLSGANAYLRHHVHLCHEHGMDSCEPGHRATGGVDHKHFFGRW
jgi:hypothetical protein